MDKTALTGKYTFEFYDGTTCDMSLAFIQLKRLSSKNKTLYSRCQKILAHGAEDELDTLTVLYAAYVCAHLDEESLMSEDVFIEKCGYDRKAIMKALTELTTAKKQKASESRSA